MQNEHIISFFNFFVNLHHGHLKLIFLCLFNFGTAQQKLACARASHNVHTTDISHVTLRHLACAKSTSDRFIESEINTNDTIQIWSSMEINCFDFCCRNDSTSNRFAPKIENVPTAFRTVHRRHRLFRRHICTSASHFNLLKSQPT